MAGIIDTSEVMELSGYLKNVSTRLQKLQKNSGEISSQLNQISSNTGIKREGLTRDLGAIKNDLTCVKEEVRSIQKSILGIIDELKGSIKAEDLERFKKRMDLWSPESLVTRKEADKVLKQI